MYEYEDDDLPIVCEDEVTREQIKRGLLYGNWKIHAVDASGLTWFIQDERELPASDEEDDLADYQGTIAGTIAAERPEIEDVPVDIQATDWFRELQAGATVDVPEDLTLRFVDRSANSISITPGKLGSND